MTVPSTPFPATCVARSNRATARAASRDAGAGPRAAILTTRWPGPTAEHNLAALCRHHHRVKHRDGHLGRWSVRRIPAGPGYRTSGAPYEHTAVLEWTSPGGLVHRPAPEHVGGRHVPADHRSTPAAAQFVDDPLPFDRAGDPPPF